MTAIECYSGLLFISALACTGFGAYSWLNNGEWLTVSSFYLIYKLESGNIIRELLLTETSWVGFQNLSSWYLQQNIGWSFIFTIIVIYITLLFTT